MARLLEIHAPALVARMGDGGAAALGARAVRRGLARRRVSRGAGGARVRRGVDGAGFATSARSPVAAMTKTPASKPATDSARARGGSAAIAHSLDQRGSVNFKEARQLRKVSKDVA